MLDLLAVGEPVKVQCVAFAEGGEVVTVVQHNGVVVGRVAKFDVLVHLFQFVELGAPCAVGTDNTIVYEVALVGCVGPVVACAVLVETILGEVACLDVVG